MSTKKKFDLKKAAIRTNTALEKGQKKNILPGMVLSGIIGLISGTVVYDFIFNVSQDQKKILSKHVESEYIDRHAPLISKSLKNYEVEFFELCDPNFQKEYILLFKLAASAMNYIFIIQDAALKSQETNLVDSNNVRRFVEFANKALLVMQNGFSRKNDWLAVDKLRKQIIVELVENSNFIDMLNPELNWI